MRASDHGAELHDLPTLAPQARFRGPLGGRMLTPVGLCTPNLENSGFFFSWRCFSACSQIGRDGLWCSHDEGGSQAASISSAQLPEFIPNYSYNMSKSEFLSVSFGTGVQ